MIYLMNSAVMPAGNYGTYRYSPAALSDLRAVVSGGLGPWTSTLGYPQNAELVERWAGVRPDINRVETHFADGDQALVMRLKYRTDPMRKGAPVSSLPEDWEFAWVRFTRQGGGAMKCPTCGFKGVPLTHCAVCGTLIPGLTPPLAAEIDSLRAQLSVARAQTARTRSRSPRQSLAMSRALYINCPYCGRELESALSACCGEIGHACSHESSDRRKEYDNDGCGYYVLRCEACGYEAIDDMP